MPTARQGIFVSSPVVLHRGKRSLGLEASGTVFTSPWGEATNEACRLEATQGFAAVTWGGQDAGGGKGGSTGATPRDSGRSGLSWTGPMPCRRNRRREVSGGIAATFSMGACQARAPSACRPRACRHRGRRPRGRGIDGEESGGSPETTSPERSPKPQTPNPNPEPQTPLLTVS